MMTKSQHMIHSAIRLYSTKVTLMRDYYRHSPKDKCTNDLKAIA